jgi:DGQHR domain-containing protein
VSRPGLQASDAAATFGDSGAPTAMQDHAVIVPNRMAFATMNPAAMKRLFFVSSFSVADPKSPAPRQHGYQRDPMEPRLGGIARYFQTDDHQYLITPIIVSVRLDDEDDIATFIRLFDEGDFNAIHARWHRAVCSVIDGQHRYLGLVKAHDDHPGFDPVVPVMLYFDLTYRDEAEMFDTINSTQRKLPKALIEVTKGDITEAGVLTHDQVIRNICFALSRDSDSVWYQQVNMTGARDPSRSVTYEGLRRSTVNMFPMEVISRLRVNGLEPEQVAKDYWHMVSEACSDAWDERPLETLDPDTGEIVEMHVDYRIKELVGVASIAKLGKDIITSSLENPHFQERMSDLVSLLGEVDWAKRDGNPWTAGHAGFSGQKDLYTKLHNLVYLRAKPGDPIA